MIVGQPFVLSCDLQLDTLGVPVRLVIDGVEIEEVVLRKEPDGNGYTIEPLGDFCVSLSA